MRRIRISKRYIKEVEVLNAIDELAQEQDVIKGQVFGKNLNTVASAKVSTKGKNSIHRKISH